MNPKSPKWTSNIYNKFFIAGIFLMLFSDLAIFLPYPQGMERYVGNLFYISIKLFLGIPVLSGFFLLFWGVSKLKYLFLAAGLAFANGVMFLPLLDIAQSRDSGHDMPGMGSFIYGMSFQLWILIGTSILILGLLCRGLFALFLPKKNTL